MSDPAVRYAEGQASRGHVFEDYVPGHSKGEPFFS